MFFDIRGNGDVLPDYIKVSLIIYGGDENIFNREIIRNKINFRNLKELLIKKLVI